MRDIKRVEEGNLRYPKEDQSAKAFVFLLWMQLGFAKKRHRLVLPLPLKVSTLRDNTKLILAKQNKQSKRFSSIEKSSNGKLRIIVYTDLAVYLYQFWGNVL